MDRLIDIGTPGAVGLVLQAILPYVLFSGASLHEANVHITIKGGTNVTNSPSVDYIQHVLRPMLEHVGVPPIRVCCHHRGWSTGRNEVGSVTFEIKPFALRASLPAFKLTERGDITKITAVLLGTKASEMHFHREISKATSEAFPDIPLEITFELSGHEKRLYVLLVAHTSTNLRLGRDHLFQERISSLDNAIPKLVARVVEDLQKEIKHGGCVDEYMQDQLVVFQALAKGRSKILGGRNAERKAFEASLHAQTAQWVAAKMIDVAFEEDECEGVGLVVGEAVSSSSDDIPGAFKSFLTLRQTQFLVAPSILFS